MARRGSKAFGAYAASLLGLGLLIAAGSRAAAQEHDHIAIWSTEEGGGQLTLEWDFPTKKVHVFRSFCAPGAGLCLYTSVNPAFLAPTMLDDDPDDALYPIADGTRISLEIVAIDRALTLNINGNRLTRPGDRTSLGTQPHLHAHPSWQLLVAEGEVGDYGLSYFVSADSPAYADSDVYTTTVTNRAPALETPVPTPTATPRPITCPGDCSGDSAVTVDEIVRVVNVALTGIDDCGSIDVDSDGRVTVDEVVLAVNAALEGCPPAPTPLPVDLQEIQDTIFTPACLDAGCHNSRDRLAGLDLTEGAAHGALVRVVPSNAAAAANGLLRVDPGRPDNSFLLTKIIAPRPEHGSRMPLNRPALAAEDIDLIRRWILQGALP